jgi:hypothetical protein
LTVVVTGPAVLLLGVGSLVALDTIAVLLNVPAAVGVTTIVIVTVALPFMAPTLHVTVPLAIEHVPCVEDADTYVTPAGSVSDTVTPDAEFEPLL